MNDRFNELLPWYVNDTLPAEDRAWVEEHLRSHPEAVGQLQWYRSLQARLHEDAPTVSDEIGLNRVMARIRAEREAKVRAPRAQQAPTLMQRLRDWLAGMNMTPAFAGAAAVVLAQAVVIAGLALRPADESTEIRAIKPSLVEAGPLLKINFKADAKEADIRLLLIEVRGSLAGGPGQLGDYFVRVPAGHVDEAAARLKTSAIVEAVAVVDGLPAKE